MLERKIFQLPTASDSGGFDGLNYVTAVAAKSFTLEGLSTENGVTYSGQSHGESFSLTGIKSANGVSVSGGTVTLTESAFDLNSDSAFQVTLTQDNSNISNAVNFELHFSGLNTSPQSVSATLIKSGTDYIYRSPYTAAYFDGTIQPIEFNLQENNRIYTINLSGTSAGYQKSGDEYIWQDKVGGLTLTENDCDISNGKIVFKPTDECCLKIPLNFLFLQQTLQITRLTIPPCLQILKQLLIGTALTMLQVKPPQIGRQATTIISLLLRRLQVEKFLTIISGDTIF